MWAGRLVFAMSAAASASGCVLPAKMRGVSPLGVDASSQVARDVAYANKDPGPYPKFSQIPRLPTDVPSPTTYRERVLAVKQDQAVLEAQAKALPPPDAGADSLATDLRSRLPDQSEAPPEGSAEQTDAYARALRERATPPPAPR